ncbi:MAG: glycosyltransferase [Candidatus Limnocylindrales bacterium]
MINRPPADGDARPVASLLFVATVAHTIWNFLEPYATHFRTLGWRVDAAANGVSDEPALHSAFDHVYEIPLSRSVLDPASLVGGARAISRLIEDDHDIIHVHTPIAAFITRYAARRLPAERRPAVIYTAHGFHFYPGGPSVANAVFLTAERIAGRWTDRLVVINDEDYIAARKHRIVPSNRLVRMPGIGIDTAWFSRKELGADAIMQACQAAGVDLGAPLFVVVGEVNRNKRQADAVRALALLRHPRAQMALIGPGDTSRLRALATELGVSDRIRFAGILEDVRPLVACATALVLPSKREGLARSIMEALALEIPVVASTARGNLELIGADRGFVIPTGDVGGMAKALDWLVDHPDEARQMGRRGRERMVERYDLRNLIRLHEDLYGDVLGSRGTIRR